MQSETNIFFLSFWAIFCPPHPPPPHLTIWKIKTLKKKKKKASRDVIILHSAPKITIIRCMFPERWSVTNILSFWAIFCTFTPISTLKMETQKKCKKTGDIILLLMCTIYEDHMMYGLFGAILVSFWAIFCPFNPLKGQKIK